MNIGDFERIVSEQCSDFTGSSQCDWTKLVFRIINKVCVNQNFLGKSTTIRTSDKSIEHEDKDRSWESSLRINRNLMLDFAAVQWGEDDDKPVNDHILLTAESEMNTSHWVEMWKEAQGNQDFFWGDYHWDFYKLLMFPSPLRLFFARVAGKKNEPMADRMGILRENINRLYLKYGGAGCRENDQIFAVIFPSASRKIEEREVWEVTKAGFGQAKG